MREVGFVGRTFGFVIGMLNGLPITLLEERSVIPPYLVLV